MLFPPAYTIDHRAFTSQPAAPRWRVILARDQSEIVEVRVRMLIILIVLTFELRKALHESGQLGHRAGDFRLAGCAPELTGCRKPFLYHLRRGEVFAPKPAVEGKSLVARPAGNPVVDHVSKADRLGKSVVCNERSPGSDVIYLRYGEEL